MLHQDQVVCDDEPTAEDIDEVSTIDITGTNELKGLAG